MFSASVRPSVRVAVCARNTRIVARVSKKSVVERRDILAALISLPLVSVAGGAQALIPDDDDEELVNKAKANRANKLKKERTIEREFVSGEGIRDRSIEQALIPVQTAVYKLAKTGEALEGGNTAAAASELSASWVGDFNTAVAGLSITSAAMDSIPKIASGLKDAKAAASAGDSGSAKKSFVETVSAVEAWAVSAGVAGQLKGL